MMLSNHNKDTGMQKYNQTKDGWIFTSLSVATVNNDLTMHNFHTMFFINTHLFWLFSFV